MKSIPFSLLLATLITLVSCGGGSSNGGSSGGGGGVATNHTVGGTVAGLPVGASLVLQDNGGDVLPVSSNAGFTFATLLPVGSAYTVTVSKQPAGATCGITNASGTVQSASITDINVSCGVTTTVTATTGSTAFSALSAGDSRIAMVPLNLPRSNKLSHGVMPVVIDGQASLKGSYVATSFAIQSCSTDSANLVAICMNYSSSTVAVLDLAKFATSLDVADIGEREYDTGAPASLTNFSGGACLLCGLVAVPTLKSFVVSAYDGYRVYAYPSADATSPIAPVTSYAVPITENFALSNLHGWIISADYVSNGLPRMLRVIDLVQRQAYTWTNFTNLCRPSDGVACSNFGSQSVDSLAFSDDTGLLTLVNENGDAQLTVDMSQAVFNSAASTFDAPYAYSDFSTVDALGLGEMSGLLVSSIGHWGYTVAEFTDAVIGVQQLPASGGANGGLTLPASNPIYVNLSTLANHGPCTLAPIGSLDPHAQGYTLSSSGVPLGLFVSGDSSCMAVINFALLYAAPRQPSPHNNLLDTSSYDPVQSGAVTFYSVPSE